MRQSSARLQQSLNIFFFGSLALALTLRMLDQSSWLFAGDWQEEYGVGEWLINYQGGFSRRGLPGEILFQIGKHTHLNIGWLVFIVSIVLYCFYFAAVSNEARKIFPFWGLCSAPLLGFPVYSGDIIRKDVLLLLCVFGTAKIISSSKPSLSRQLLIALTTSAAILSHELYIFFGIPMCLVMNLFSIWKKGVEQRWQNIVLSTVGWAPPFVAAVLVLRSRGSDQQGVRILESWSALTPAPGPSASAIPEPLWWLGRSPRDAIEMTHSLHSTIYYNVPYWALVVMAIALAATAITLLFRKPESRSSFAIYFLLQTAFMAPIFYSALDQGRWIFLTVNSAFIFTLLFPVLRAGRLSSSIQYGVEHLRAVVPPAVCVLALSIWSFPVIRWGLRAWILNTPLFLLPGRVYLEIQGHLVSLATM